MNRRRINKLSVGAAVLALAAAGAGSYVARAETDARAVNAAPPAAAAAAPGVTRSFADIVERVAPAVVSIEVDGKAVQPAIADPRRFGFGWDDDDGLPGGIPRFFGQTPYFQPQPVHGAGSGFFISPDGYIVTNNHVIENADKITVRTADQRSLTARVIGRDKATDLAVIKVDVKNSPFVSFEDRAKPRVGDWVVAVGNPFGLGGTATAGIVSAFGRQSGSSYVDYMQIDASINPGNSGGPTFDLNGRVVGINSAIFSRSGGSVGIGFDIPADVAASVTKQLISGGRISRGYIGATVQDVTAEIAEGLGVEDKGAIIASVAASGPAQAAGLKAGDQILRINGHAVSNAADLTRQVGLARAGEVLRFDLRRDGRPLQLSVRSGTRPDEDRLADNDAAPEPAGVTLGLSVTPDSDRDGLRIAGVTPGSAAAAKGLRRGDLIVRAGDRATRSSEDLTDAVREAKAKGRKQILLLVARQAQRTFVPVELGQG